MKINLKPICTQETYEVGQQVCKGEKIGCIYIVVKNEKIYCHYRQLLKYGGGMGYLTLTGYSNDRKYYSITKFNHLSRAAFEYLSKNQKGWRLVKNETKR